MPGSERSLFMSGRQKIKQMLTMSVLGLMKREVQGTLAIAAEGLT